MRPDRNMDMEIQIMKKQEISAQPVVGEDKTAVDTLSAELVQAVGVEADAVDQSFQDEKKLEDEVLAAKSGEQALVASTDDGVSAMIMADTNAQAASTGAAVGGGGAAAGGLSTGTLIAGGVVGAVAIGAAVNSSSDSKGAPPNVAPESAATQSVAVTEDTAKTITVTATDGNGDALTYSAAGATKGTVTGGTNGQFTYTPNANANGTDSFTVTIDDGKGGTTTQLVNLTIAAVNDAPVANTVAPVTTAEDTPATINVVASDVDGDTLTYTATAQNGSVAVGANGALTYTPNANFNGTDSVVITVADGNGGTTTQTVAVTVTPVNDAPVTAATQAVTTAEDTATTVTVTGSDVDGDTLTYSAGTASNGVVTAGAASGDFVYTPNADFNGTDSFVVTVADGNGGTTTQTVNVSVSPVAEDYTLTVAATDSVEGNTGSNNKLNYVLTLDKAPPAGESVTITVATAPGDTNPASAGSDYVTGLVQITFGPGETTKLFSVDINGDTAFEQDESVKLNITAPSNVTVAGDLEALILNDDSAKQVFEANTSDNLVGTDQDDTFTAGTSGAPGGTAPHSLGTGDSVDGGAGTDTLKYFDNVGRTNTLQTSTNVENLEVSITGGTPGPGIINNTLAFSTSVSGFEKIVNTSDVNNNFAITGLTDVVAFEQINGASATTVTYSTAGVQAMKAAASLSVGMNNANGATFTFTNLAAGDVTTLNLAAEGPVTTAFTNGTIAGVVGLTTVNLTGAGNFAGQGNLATDAAPAAIFKDVTTFNASASTGNVAINLLGDAGAGALADRNIAYSGSQGKNTLTIGQGNNTIVMQGGNDSVVLSSTGFNAQDSYDGGAGTDSLSIHFNDIASADGVPVPGGTTAGGIDDASDAAVLALNKVVNVENLVIDAWAQTEGVGGLENVDLNASLINNFTGFVFTDTRVDGAGAAGNNINDLDIDGTVAVAGVKDVNTFTFNTDQLNALSFTAATGASTLNLAFAGHDAAAEVGDIDTINGNVTANGFSTVNFNVQNQHVAGQVNGTSIGNFGAGDVLLQDGATLNMTGTTDVLFLNVDQIDRAAVNGATFGGTVDASGLVTLGDRTSAAGQNFFLIEQATIGTTMRNVNVIGTGQDDDIFGTDGVDMLQGGAGNDLLQGNAGDDILIGGAGNDVLIAGDGTVGNQRFGGAFKAEGLDTLDGGAGNDIFQFTFSTIATQSGLDDSDIVIGGEGNDTVQILNAATLDQGIYNNWTSVENLQLADGGANTVLIGQIGFKAGVQKIIGGNNNDTFGVADGFTGPITLDLSANGIDIINSPTAKGAITAFMQGGDVDAGPGGDVFSFGVNAADTMVLQADGTLGINLDAITGGEFINLVSTATPNGADIGIVLTNNAVLNTMSAGVTTLTIDASGMHNFTNAIGVVNTADATVDAKALGGGTTTATLLINGGDGNDTLEAGGNSDTINGGLGNDIIYGGAGSDMLTGGAGNDVFDYDAVSESSGVTTIDKILDFMSANDAIDVDVLAMFAGTGFGLNPAGGSDGNGLNFAGNHITSALQGAMVANDGVIDYIFDTTNSTLWVDTDDDATLTGSDLQISLVGVSAIAQFDVIDIAV